MKFKNACLKLTLYYILIVMFISNTFSVALYSISAHEINFGLRRQERILHDLPRFENVPEFFPDLDFEKMRLEQLQTAKRALLINLLRFNLAILILSGGLSYWLAWRTLKPIEEMLETQKRFTADASHELRTPLTAMKAEIEVGLRDKNFNAENARVLLKSNLEEIEKLENLSGALLKLARYEEGKNIVFEEISLEDVVAEAYLRVEKLAVVKEINFENTFADIKIKGDKVSLTELFVILLDNAIKYSPRQSEILITIGKTDRRAYVEIKDRGVGITKEEVTHIFDRFYRSDPSRSKMKTDGYGLGLAIAQKIVQLHKGEIKVKSELSKGSVFTILLPAKI